MEHLGHHVFGQIALQVLQEAQQCPAPDLGGEEIHQNTICHLMEHGPDVVVRPHKLLSIISSCYHDIFRQMGQSASLGCL